MCDSLRTLVVISVVTGRPSGAMGSRVRSRVRWVPRAKSNLGFGVWSCPLPLPSDLSTTRSIPGTRGCAHTARFGPRHRNLPFSPAISCAVAMPASLGPSTSTSSQPLQQQATASPDGSSTSSTEMDVTGSPSAPQLRQLPGHFEDVAMDDLVVLIGQDCVYNVRDYLLILWFHYYPYFDSRSPGPNNRAQRPNTAQRVRPIMATMCVHSPARSPFVTVAVYDHRDALTRFHSRSPPAISVLDYLKRIVRYIPRIEVGLPLPPVALLLAPARPSHVPPAAVTNSRTCLSALSYSSFSTTLTGSVLNFQNLPFHRSPSTDSSSQVSPLLQKPSATPLRPTHNLLALVVSASSNSTSSRRNSLPSLIGAWL